MATINFATREITAKIVYFGATDAGCNTNVERLHALVAGRSKSALSKLGPPQSEERSLYFDYVSNGPGPIDAFAIGFRLYSLPGRIALAAHREEVMKDVDAMVFVADARSKRNPANVDALLELEGLLTAHGLEMSAIPVVIQVNRTDDLDARPVEDVVFDLNPFGFPVVAAVARQDIGILDAHLQVADAVVQRIRNTITGQTPTLRLTAVHDPTRDTHTDVIRRHEETISERASVSPASDLPPAQPPPPPTWVEGGEIEVAFQPRELVGSHPLQVLTAAVDGDKVRVELLMERMGGGEARKLTVFLANRPTDTMPVPRSPSVTTSAEPPGDRVFDYLPDPGEEEVEEITDLPGLWYGILGVASGIVIGLLSGYLAGIVL
jgi:mutual gliding-motility protein MglA